MNKRSVVKLLQKVTLFTGSTNSGTNHGFGYSEQVKEKKSHSNYVYYVFLLCQDVVSPDWRLLVTTDTQKRK
jgi:hypothetical protein